MNRLTFYAALPVLVPLCVIAVIGCIGLAIVAEWVEREFYDDADAGMGGE